MTYTLDITPSNSYSTNTKYNTNTYTILQKEISLFNSFGGDILPGGDFNSRMSTKYKDFNISDSNNFLPRNSQDKKSKTNGRHLAYLCMVNNLKNTKWQKNW